MTAEIRDHVNETRDALDRFRALARLLEGLAEPFADYALGLQVASFGGDADYTTYESVVDGLRKMAENVRECGMAEQP